MWYIYRYFLIIFSQNVSNFCSILLKVRSAKIVTATTLFNKTWQKQSQSAAEQRMNEL